MKYYVYILKSLKDGRFYIGYTSDLERRFIAHNEQKQRYTSKFSPWEMVYSEEFQTKKEAIIREGEIKKKKSHSYIDYLISVKALSG